MTEAFHVKQKGLGKGLSALLGEDSSLQRLRAGEQGGDIVQSLLLSDVVPGMCQPRKYFDKMALDELAQSIRTNGVLQPIVVRPRPDGQYEILAGERRWRASQLAGKEEIPAVIRKVSDESATEIALLENIQREDLNPLEEAQAYSTLIDQYDYTQEELSNRIGKSRSHISNLMRLLSLPEDVQNWIHQGRITMGHARALLASNDPTAAALDIIAQKLSVRETEQKVLEEKGAIRQSRPRKKIPASGNRADEKSEDILAIEKDLSEKLGLQVEIFIENGEGDVRIKFHSLQDLDKVLMVLGKGQR